VSDQPPLPEVAADHGICPACLTRRKLKDDGRLVLHRISWQVSAATVRAVGAGSVSRICPGSGAEPRPPDQGGPSTPPAQHERRP
jgi:hypothetical protein